MSAKENFIINYDTNEIKRNDIKKVDILFDFNGNNSLISPIILMMQKLLLPITKEV